MPPAPGPFFHSLYNRTVVSNIALAGVFSARNTSPPDLSIVFEPFVRQSGTPLHTAFPTGPDRKPLVASRLRRMELPPGPGPVLQTERQTARRTPRPLQPEPLDRV